MAANIDSTDGRTVWWKLSVFDCKGMKQMDLIHAAVDIAQEKLLDGRSPDTEIEYLRTKEFFLARVGMTNAGGLMKRLTKP